MGIFVEPGRTRFEPNQTYAKWDNYHWKMLLYSSQFHSPTNFYSLASLCWNHTLIFGLFSMMTPPPTCSPDLVCYIVTKGCQKVTLVYPIHSLVFVSTIIHSSHTQIWPTNLTNSLSLPIPICLMPTLAKYSLHSPQVANAQFLSVSHWAEAIDSNAW